MSPFGLARQPVDLVPDLDDRLVGRDAELGEHADNVERLRRVIGVRDVADMQDDVGADHLFERGAERRDEVVRQLGDETDGIGQHDLTSVWQRQLAERRVEGGEQQVLGEHLGAGQLVEQRRLAGVGIADERHQRVFRRILGASLLLAAALHLVEAILDERDAFAQQAPVGFDLRFAGAAGEAEAATLPLKVGPRPHQPALLVVEVRKLDLQHALAGRGALAEDFEDKARAIEHLGLGFGFEIALLHRRERGVDEQQLDLTLLDLLRDRLDLAAAEEGPRLDLAHLDDLGEDHLDPNGISEALELGQPRFDRMPARLAPDIRAHQTDPRRLLALVDKGFATTLVVVLVVEIVCHVRPLSPSPRPPRARDRRAGWARRA